MSEEDKNTQPSPPQQVEEDGNIRPPQEPDTFEEAEEDAEPDFEAEETHEDGDE